MTAGGRARDFDPDEIDFLDRHAGALEALRRRVAECPPPDVISAFGSGALPEEEANRIRTHLTACSLCTALLEGLHSAAASESSVGQPQVQRVWNRVTAMRPQWRTGILTPRILGPAAAAVLILFAGVRMLDRRPTVPTETASTPAVPAAATPAFLLPIEKAGLILPLDALTWRGSENSPSSQYLVELGNALAPYHRDDFAGAAESLAALTQRYPNGVEAWFYLGVSRLFLDRPEEALASLERARNLDSATLAFDIEWHLAVARERQGMPEEAAAILQRLCTEESAYRARSCAMYPRLTNGRQP